MFPILPNALISYIKVAMTRYFVQYFLDCIAKITVIHNITSLVEFL